MDWSNNCATVTVLVVEYEIMHTMVDDLIVVQFKSM